MEWAWRELGASNQKEYEKNRKKLKKLIDQAKVDIVDLKTMHELRQFIIDFKNKINWERPFGVELGVSNENVENIEQLSKWKYPQEFIQWHEAYGQDYFFIESMRISPTETVIEELEGSYYELLTKNGYRFITGDGGGNCYVYNMNITPPEIKFVDHETAYGQVGLLDEMYSEYFDFWEEDDSTYHNPNEMDISEIFVSEGEYNVTSKYVKQYFDEDLKDTGYSDLFEFIKDKLVEGLLSVEGRYDLNDRG